MLQGCLLNCALQVIRNCRDAMPFLGISRILAARQRFDLSSSQCSQCACSAPCLKRPHGMQTDFLTIQSTNILNLTQEIQLVKQEQQQPKYDYSRIILCVYTYIYNELCLVVLSKDCCMIETYFTQGCR